MDLVQLVALNASIGPFLPPLIGAVNQSHWPKFAKTMVTVGICAGVGVLTTLANGELIGRDLPAAILACTVATLVAYHAYWKKAGLPDFEEATSVNRPSA